MSDLPAGVAGAVRLLLADLDGAALERVAATVRARGDAAVAAGDGDGHTAMSAMSALVSERRASSPGRPGGCPGRRPLDGLSAAAEVPASRGKAVERWR
jgi:hypothetical protein